MLLGTALVLPLLVAALIVFSFAPVSPARTLSLRRFVTVSAPLATVPAAALSLVSSPGAHGTDSPPRWEVDWLLFGSVFVVDPLARSLTLVASLLFGAALMSVTWVKLRGDRGTEPRSSALSAFLLVCFSGTVGTFVAGDVVTFYLAFAVMSFSAAGLVIHYRTDSARRATRIYLIMSVFSETAILGGLLLTAGAGGFLLEDAPAAIAASDHTGLIVSLLLIGCGVKAGTVPLHIWLPLAHPAAPPAASAVLSGAMVKAGLVGWLRFFVPGEQGQTAGADALATAGWVLMGAALVGAFAAAVIGVLQNDPKVVLAYSTISQMGFLTVLVAVGMITPELSEATQAAAILYAVHHGLAKGVLFLGVPVVSHYGRGLPGVLVLIGMAGAALAVAGAPLTSGAYGKYITKDTVEGLPVLGGLSSAVTLDHVLPLVATGSTLLLMRFAYIMVGKQVEPRRADGELFSWLVVCAAGVSLPWMVGQWWIPAAGGFSWEASALWDSTWPILLGLALGGAVWWASSRRRLPSWLRADGSLIAPGDLVVPEESLVARAGSTVTTAVDGGHRLSSTATARAASATGALAELIRTGMETAQRRISGWRPSGAVILLLLTAAVAALAVSALLDTTGTGL